MPGTLDGAIDRLALCDLRAGKPFAAEGGDRLTFHCGLAGPVHAAADGSEEIVVPAGWALLLPAGQSLRIAAGGEQGAGRRGGALDARVMIGGVSPRAAATLGLAKVTGPLLHEATRAPGAAALMAALADELDSPTIGTIPLASALMKLCLVQAARDTAEPMPAAGGSRIGGAVSAVLNDPGAAHSIASLAGLARMSRATFIRHFAKLMGTNPMRFVAKARLDHAAELLRSTDLPIKIVANRIGFRNRSHFSRAFRREHGVEPSLFRKSPSSPDESLAGEEKTRAGD